MPRRTEKPTPKKSSLKRATRADPALDGTERDRGAAPADSESADLHADLESAQLVDDEDRVPVGDDDDDGTDDEEELDEDEVPVPVPPRVAPAVPAARPSPGRPPSAKDEPEPPFLVGERVELIKNTRPRTGTPIGNHRVGAMGRVETVLSQTAIVRFDDAPDTKEVVAFVCLESRDPEAQQRRKERELELEAERAARDTEKAPPRPGGA